MKILRRLFAVILTVAVALTALSVTAWADSIEDTAVTIASGETVETVLHTKWDTTDYKIDVSKSGMLSLDVVLEISQCYIYVYDSNGNQIDVWDASLSTYEYTFRDNFEGEDYFYTSWNPTLEKFEGSITYKVDKGTYYIRVERACYRGDHTDDGAVKLTATFPQDTTATTSPTATDGSILSTIKSMLVYFTVDIPKGSTLQLGAITPNLSVPISWISHNTNVVTITTNGKVTAKAKGSAYIAIRFGPNVRIVQVNVV